MAQNATQKELRYLSTRPITDLRTIEDWLEALYELWIIERHKDNNAEYSFYKGMSRHAQIQVLQDLRKRWLEDRQFTMRQGGIRNGNGEVYENMDQIPTIRESIEIAHRDRLNISLQDLLQAYLVKNVHDPVDSHIRSFLFLDLFHHVLDYPLVFFSSLADNSITEGISVRPPQHLWMSNVPLKDLCQKPWVYWLMAFKEIAWKTCEPFYNIDPIVWGDEAVKEQAISEDFQHYHQGGEQHSAYLTGNWESLYSESILNLRRVVEDHYEKRAMVGIRDMNLNQILVVDGACYSHYYETLYASVLLHPLSFFGDLPKISPDREAGEKDNQTTGKAFPEVLQSESYYEGLNLSEVDKTIIFKGESLSEPKSFKIIKKLINAQGSPVEMSTLKKELWEADPPDNWKKEIRDRISRLRGWFKKIDPDFSPIPTAKNGTYRINLDSFETKN